MPTSPNFNHTRNSTTFSPLLDSNRSNETDFGSERNRSNETDFGSGNGNGTRPDMNPFNNGSEAMFYLLVTLVIPSILCFLFVFYNFIRLPNLRTKPSNLLIICLLIINFIHMLADLPFRLFFLSQNQVLIEHPPFCLVWTWYDNILTTTDLFVMAFTSIERYLSIFHHIFLRRHKRLLYSVPIVVCFAIPTIWFTVLIFGYPCRNSFSYFIFQCGTLCYLTNSEVFINFENFVFFIFPLSIIVVGNSTLIICVLIQKRSMKRNHRLRLWQNNFRMISQLMFIAILYMGVYIPSCILLIFGSYVRHSRFQPGAANVRLLYFTHLKYLVIFGCPFMVLAGQTDMHHMIKKFLSHIPHARRLRWKTQIIPMKTVPTMLNGTTRG